jgi:hypothetical protein
MANLTRVSGVLVLAAVFGCFVPLFLCAPPWVDNTFFDICARTVTQGGVLYRDIFAHGPPGMVLLQAAVRSVFGWSNVGLHAADLLIVAAICCLLLVPHRNEESSSPVWIWMVVAIFLFYFSTTEWSHCQSDTWMMLPAAAAFRLRKERVATSAAGTKAALSALLEGLCWGMALAIKPFVLLPAASCWLVGMVVARRNNSSWRQLLEDSALCGVGVALIGAGLACWLYYSGNWPYFWQATLSNWNQDYYATSVDWIWRSRHLWTWFPGWSCIHLLAVPLAAWRVAGATLDRPKFLSRQASNQALFGAFYLGWLLQAAYLQRQFPYQHVPPVLLGMAFIAGEPRIRIPFLVACIAWSLYYHPLLDGGRLAVWQECIRLGSTPQVRDRLSLESDAAAADWEKLESVKDFLKARKLHDRQLTCYAISAIHLYEEMGLRPSTRFIELGSAIGLFRGHQDNIGRELATSPERYIVNDLRLLGLSAEEAGQQSPGDAPSLSDSAGKSPYPWMFPIVFRAGRYLVHERPVRGG